MFYVLRLDLLILLVSTTTLSAGNDMLVDDQSRVYWDRIHPDRQTTAKAVRLSTSQNLTVSVNKGVILERIGDFTISSHHWILAVDFYLKDIDLDFANIENAIATLTKELNQTDLSRLRGSHVYLFEMINSIRLSKLKTLKYLDETVIELKDAYRDIKRITLKMKLSNKKKRRSLLPIIGDTSKLLFGTATTKDLEKLNARLESQASNQKRIIQFEKEQATLLLAAQSKITENRQLLIHLKRTTGQMQVAIDKLEEAITDVYQQLKEIHILAHATSAVHDVQECIDILITAIDALRTEIAQLLIALQSAENGRLDRYFLDSNQLKEVLEEIKRKLPSTLQLAIQADNAQLYAYYEQVRVTTISMENKIRLMLDIPLTVPGMRFELTRIHSWPTPVKNGTKLSYMLDSKAKHIAVSYDRQSFVELTDEEALICMKGIQVCSPQSGIFSHPVQSCLYGLVRGHDTSKLCSFKVAELEQPRVQRIGESNNWSFFLVEPTSFTISCMGEAPYDEDLKDSGVLKLESGCSAYAKGIMIPRRYKMHSTVEVEPENHVKLPELPMFRFSFSESKAPVFNKSNWLKEDLKVSSLESIEEIGVNIKNLKRKLTLEEQRMDSQSKIKHLENSIGIAGGLIITGVIVVVVVVVWKHRRKIVNCTKTKPVESVRTFFIEPPRVSKPVPLPRVRKVGAELEVASWTDEEDNSLDCSNVQ